MDSQVEGLALKIKNNFNEELTNALNQLDTIGQNQEILDQLEKEAKVKEKGQAQFTSARHNYRAKPKSLAAHTRGTDIYQQRETNKTDVMPAILKSPHTKYKYFDSVAWINDKGMQSGKWTIRSYNTQFISAIGREYFDNVRRGRFYELPDHKFWLEPVISRNTGRNQVAISKQFSNKISKEPWIVVADMRLLSLMDPVLPAGYGYAIIAKGWKSSFPLG